VRAGHISLDSLPQIGAARRAFNAAMRSHLVAGDFFGAGPALVPAHASAKTFFPFDWLAFGYFDLNRKPNAGHFVRLPLAAAANLCERQNANTRLRACLCVCRDRNIKIHDCENARWSAVHKIAVLEVLLRRPRQQRSRRLCFGRRECQRGFRKASSR
jgi:hypothetical protein